MARRMARRLALRGQQEDSRLLGPTGWEDTEVLRLVRPPSETAPKASLKVSSSVNSWHCGQKGGRVTSHTWALIPLSGFCSGCPLLSGSCSLSPPLAHPSRLSSVVASSRKLCVISTLSDEPPIRGRELAWQQRNPLHSAMPPLIRPHRCLLQTMQQVVMLVLESRTVPDTQRLLLSTATVLQRTEQRDKGSTLLPCHHSPPTPIWALPTSRPPFCLYCRKALVVPLFANRILAKRTFYRERRR